MYILRKLIIAAITIGLLEGLKLLMDSLSPASELFHRQFILVLQVMIGAWFFVLLILFLFNKHRSWTARFLPVILALLVIVLDMWFDHLLDHPAKIPQGLLPAYRDYYDRFEKKDLYYEPCTVYDSARGPMIIPGLEFVFGNIEYQNQYRVNSASFRDNEYALFGPQIVFAGGSITFGCGVDSAQTFAALLARSMARKVLNAGSIYSDPFSQLIQLSKADTSVVEHLVFEIPMNYGDSSKRANITADQYAHGKMRYNWSREYFPGKIVMSVLISKLIGWFSPAEQKIMVPGMLPDQLIKVANSTSGKIILMVHNFRNERPDNPGLLINAELKDRKFDRVRDRITVFDCSPFLSAGDYYLLNEHLNSTGHTKLAEGLIKLLEEKGD